jgi:polysaccharide export outer membrane protein
METGGHKMTLRRYLAVIVAVASCMACCRITSAQAEANKYVLGPDDIIDISVPGYSDVDRELDRELVILPDGTISYPEVGELKAAGKTPKDLAAEIQVVLRKTRKKATVIVSVREIHSKHVRISGAVRTPGSYDLRPGLHLMDLVAMAGGLTTQTVYVTGRVLHANSAQSVTLNIADAVAKPEGDSNIPLANDDLILLDEREVHNQVHIIGEVNHQGPYDLTDTMNLLSLISEAGGVTERAALRKVSVLRQFPQGGSQQFEENLYPALVESKVSPELVAFKLQAGDIVSVPQIQAKFAVEGAVNRPGYYPYPENAADATVLKLLQLGGAPLADADMRHAAIVHTSSTGATSVQNVDLQKIYKDGNLAGNQLLQPNDILFIPGRKGRNAIDYVGPLAGLATIIRLLYP